MTQFTYPIAAKDEPFSRILEMHLRLGSRPKGDKKLGKKWGRSEFADSIGVEPRTIQYWINEKKKISRSNMYAVEDKLFGDFSNDHSVISAKQQLRDAYERLQTEVQISPNAANPGVFPNPKPQLGPDSYCIELLNSGRIPFRHATSIDGCIELFGSPGGDGRYSGLAEHQVICVAYDTEWDVCESATSPSHVIDILKKNLNAWRGNDATPRQLRTIFEAPHDALSDRNSLRLSFGRSDYFTARTIRQISQSAPFDSGIGSLFPAKNWWAPADSRFEIDTPPIHVSAHALIINRDPDTGQFAIVVTAHEPRHNPIAGGASLSMEEQMTAPTKIRSGIMPWWASDDVIPLSAEAGDNHIFGTLKRGLLEEFNLHSQDYEPPLLLSTYFEVPFYFIAFNFIVKTHIRPLDLFNRWRSATDQNESPYIAIYPIGEPGKNKLPQSGISAVVELLGRSDFDPNDYVIPNRAPPGTYQPVPWHHASKMRLYVAARHLWGDSILDKVEVALAPWPER